MADNDAAEAPKVKRKRSRGSFYNTTSMIGTILAVTTLVLMVFLYVLDMFSGHNNPYVGLITFVALPPVLIFGIFLYFLGGYLTNKRLKAGEKNQHLPKIDLNDEKHRRVFTSLMVGGVIFMAISAFGSYQAYEYTDSVQFCGEVCHGVMKPEHTAYLNSPHARVKCTQCHIGEGATWYVKSKLSGAYQVYSTLFNKYSRPIPTPIHNLRPAKETCEQCHWPSHFYSQKLVDRKYYLADETNTEYQMSMLMKIGGEEHGKTEGIHAHMYLDTDIYYIATDPQRQNIPYVEARGKDGSVIIYKSSDEQISDEQIAKSEKRIVDCIDCHNRPSHRYPHPAKNINNAMNTGAIDPSLPEIKRLGVELLEGEYKTESEARTKIADEIRKFYAESYADVSTQKKTAIDGAIAQIQRIYSSSYFPEMKTSWRYFPDNTDHMYAKGCFRCHDDKHVSLDGKRKIRSDCNSCHTILTQGGGAAQKVGIKGLEFQHPVDIGEEWKTTLCRDCHAPAKE